MENDKINSLEGSVVLVTGASRGIGKGIAEHLVSCGATVYITGRKSSQSKNLPSLKDTESQLNEMKKGKCVAIYCDHANDSEVNKLFETITLKHKCLDILVNNAFGGCDRLAETKEQEKIDQNPEIMWDKIMNVGARSSYIASCKAARCMIERRSGLIVNITSMSSLVPIFSPIYCMGKEATDRMTLNMGRILKKHNVSMISLWPGPTKTELNKMAYDSNSDKMLKDLWEICEHPTLTGKAIAHLYKDSNVVSKSGNIFFVADLAHRYGFTDVGGITPTSLRSARFAVQALFPPAAPFVPHFLKSPKLFLSLLFRKL